MIVDETLAEHYFEDFFHNVERMPPEAREEAVAKLLLEFHREAVHGVFREILPVAVAKHRALIADGDEGRGDIRPGEMTALRFHGGGAVAFRLEDGAKHLLAWTDSPRHEVHITPWVDPAPQEVLTEVDRRLAAGLSDMIETTELADGLASYGVPATTSLPTLAQFVEQANRGRLRPNSLSYEGASVDLRTGIVSILQDFDTGILQSLARIFPIDEQRAHWGNNPYFQAAQAGELVELQASLSFMVARKQIPGIVDAIAEVVSGAERIGLSERLSMSRSQLFGGETGFFYAKRFAGRDAWLHYRTGKNERFVWVGLLDEGRLKMDLHMVRVWYEHLRGDEAHIRSNRAAFYDFAGLRANKNRIETTEDELLEAFAKGEASEGTRVLTLDIATGEIDIVPSGALSRCLEGIRQAVMGDVTAVREVCKQMDEGVSNLRFISGAFYERPAQATSPIDLVRIEFMDLPLLQDRTARTI